jgi:hypothetical protein
MEKIEPDGEVVAEFSGTTLFPWIAWSPLGPLLFRAWYQVTVAEATVDVHRVWGRSSTLVERLPRVPVDVTWGLFWGKVRIGTRTVWVNSAQHEEVTAASSEARDIWAPETALMGQLLGEGWRVAAWVLVPLLWGIMLSGGPWIQIGVVTIAAEIGLAIADEVVRRRAGRPTDPRPQTPRRYR